MYHCDVCCVHDSSSVVDGAAVGKNGAFIHIDESGGTFKARTKALMGGGKMPTVVNVSGVTRDGSFEWFVDAAARPALCKETSC